MLHFWGLDFLTSRRMVVAKLLSVIAVCGSSMLEIGGIPKPSPDVLDHTGQTHKEHFQGHRHAKVIISPPPSLPSL